MLLDFTLRFLGFAVGTALHLFLGVLVARKPGAARPDRLLLAVITSAGMWHAGNALAMFVRLNTGAETGPLLNLLDLIAEAGLALTPALLLHLGLVWAKRSFWPAVVGYGAVAVGLWMFATHRLVGYRFALALVLIATCVLGLLAAGRESNPLYRKFFRWSAATLLAPTVGVLIGENSALVVWTALVPAVCFAYFVYRYDFLGLLISRRLVFALVLGVFSAFYLFLVRRVADFVEDEFDFLGPLTELALISAAALIWLPLYAWMNRFVSKRTQLYDDFSKRVIEEAAGILDLEKRVQFLAEEVGRTFDLRRAVLATSGGRIVLGQFGPKEPGITADVVRKLEAATRGQKVELVHQRETGHPELREILTDSDFNYLFALRYEDHLTGFLLLDTSPRIYLDQDEPILLGLCRQISHSIETCRVVDEKIGLEKTLLQQEHLARLGKAAATIAHEVKNPLSSIKTLAQLMGEDPEFKQRYSRDLSYMVAEVDRLNSSVRQLLTFSRPAPETKSTIDLSGLLETTAGALAREQATNGVQVEYIAGPRIQIEGSSPDLVQQIVLNLALNAIQASPAGSQVTVEVQPRPRGKVAVVVTDEGPGIPEELQQRVFEPFYTTKQKETGLGLAIAKKNVRQLGGEIQIESPVSCDRGTRVTVILPVS